MQKKIYFPCLDGFRFYAFILVLLQHFQASNPNGFHQGWLSIEFFFLISAFLLTRLLREEYYNNNKVHAGFYFARRVLRIWPLYFFYLIVISIYAISVAYQYFSAPRLLGNIFFYDNILAATSEYNTNPFTYHLWHISMEEQYYLFLPFTVPWLLRQPKKKVLIIFSILLLLMVALRIWSVMNNKHHPFIYVLPISGDCFLVGMLFGLGIFDKMAAKMNSLLTFGAGLLLLSVFYFVPSRSQVGYHQVYIYSIAALALSFLFISITTNTHRILLFLFSNRPIRYLGKISFGLYVYHLACIYGVEKLLNKLDIHNDAYALLLSAVTTVILSILSYEFFEKFFLRYKKRFTFITNREP
ncbi:MAG TPA: acyltransferase [Chitinophagaceae bacterium]